MSYRNKDECILQSDCGVTEYCSTKDWKCHSKGYYGSRCTLDYQCVDGYECKHGKCKKSNDECIKDSDCGSSEYCSTKDWKCHIKGVTGDKCKFNSECFDHLKCIDNKCQAKPTSTSAVNTSPAPDPPTQSSGSSPRTQSRSVLPIVIALIIFFVVLLLIFIVYKILRRNKEPRVRIQPPPPPPQYVIPQQAPVIYSPAAPPAPVIYSPAPPAYQPSPVPSQPHIYQAPSQPGKN